MIMALMDEEITMGFIPLLVISKWKELGMKNEDLHKLSKEILIAIFRVWKERCKRNLIRF